MTYDYQLVRKTNELTDIYFTLFKLFLNKVMSRRAGFNILLTTHVDSSFGRLGTLGII